MNDGFANVSESGKSDLGLCRQNRSIRQKRSPATVHNRKSLPNFRVWGHDFPKGPSPTRKDMQAAERSEPHPGKTCALQKGQGPTRQDCAPRKRPSLNRFTASSHHPNFDGEIESSAVATRGSFASRSQQALFHSRRRPRQIGAVSPLATSQPYFALAASHAAEASRAQASISASWSRLSTFCRPPPCPASCASIMAPTQPSISR